MGAAAVSVAFIVGTTFGYTAAPEVSSSKLSGESGLASFRGFNKDYEAWTDDEGIYGWEFLAEPHRETFIEARIHLPTGLAASLAGGAEASGVAVAWTITEKRPATGASRELLSVTQYDLTVAVDDGSTSGDAGASTGAAYSSKVSVTCDTPGRELDVSVTVGGTSYSTTGACKFVRRELRGMTKEDRDSYFYALAQVHSLTTAEGQAKYGTSFRGIDEMQKQHL